MYKERVWDKSLKASDSESRHELLSILVLAVTGRLQGLQSDIRKQDNKSKM